MFHCTQQSTLRPLAGERRPARVVPPDDLGPVEQARRFGCALAPSEVGGVVLGVVPGGTKDHDGKTALHSASYYGQTACIDHLMTHGANVEAKDDNGRTPLLLSARFNQIKVVKSLIETYNASLMAVDRDGLTAWHIAAFTGNCELIRILGSGSDSYTILYMCIVTFQNIGNTISDFYTMLG